jgi:hypothetical protein
MKVKALDKEWEVKDVSYKERRKLYELNVKAFWKGEVDPDVYYSVLEKVAEISGLSDDDLKDLPMVEIDQLLQAVLSAYLGMEKNVNGD